MTCDFCNKPALYDARLPLYGAWANVCQDHFTIHGCELGLGKGQKLKQSFIEMLGERSGKFIVDDMHKNRGKK